MKLIVLGVVLALNGVFSHPVPEEAPKWRPGAPYNPHDSTQSTRFSFKHQELIDPNQEPRSPSTREVPDADAVERQAACDRNGIIAASGDDLVRRVKAADSQCINSLFSASGNDARQAFNTADMKSVAGAFASSAYYYDANNAAKDSLLQLVLYLRAGLYINSNDAAATGGAYDSQLTAQIEQGLRYFYARPNLDARNGVHYDTFGETTTLVINAHLSLKMIDTMADLLNKMTGWTSWTLLDGQQGTVVNWIFNVYWRLTWETGANEQLASKPLVYQAIDGFATRRSNLLNTAGEWLLANSNSELARLMQFASIKPKVSPLVQAQIRKYSMTNGARVWIAIASQVDFLDQANCAAYGTCNYKETAKKQLFPYTKQCTPAAYKDTFTVYAQKITQAQLDEVCMRLKAHESYFHGRLKTNWQPVKDDNNWRLNVMIYASDDDYKAYNGALYGYDTNNGGIYIEGNPADPNNIGHFFCYVATWMSKWDVWNLEHEITHYFDGRYDTYGDFNAVYQTAGTVFWAEGLGEYMANKDKYNNLAAVCQAKKYSLSSIFATKYEDGTEKVYHYGYAAVRFMFERHPNDVDKMVGFLRNNKYQDYATYVTRTLYNQYDNEFSQWCDSHRNGL